MNLTPEQRDVLALAVIPRLAQLGLRATVEPWNDPETPEAEDCLAIAGSTDGPYRTAKRVGAVLLDVDVAFAELLVVGGLTTSVAQLSAARHRRLPH